MDVSPAEKGTLPKAIFLESQIEKITGVHEFATSLADEVQGIHASQEEHAATRAYKCRDVCISHNAAFGAKGGIRKLTYARASYGPTRIEREVDLAALCSTQSGNDYFAHFIFDDACLHFLARDFAPPFFSSTKLPRTDHSLSYLDALGIDYVERPSVLVRNLWIFDDVGLNTHRRQRLETMSRLIRSVDDGLKSPAPLGAFIRRGKNGAKRGLVNQFEVEAFLTSQGFVVVDPDTQSVDEIRACLRNVPVIIGVEGSHLVHGLFNLAPGGVMICIQPAQRFNVIFRYLANALRLQWGFVVAEGSKESFRVSLDELKATLDLVEKKVSF